MESWSAICGLFAAIVSMILDVALFWRNKLLSWWRSKSPRDRLLHRLKAAQTYEEWEECAFELDELLGTDVWYWKFSGRFHLHYTNPGETRRQNPANRHYDYRLILGRLEALMSAREDEDILTLANLLRSGLVRNLGNITSPRLYIHAYAGTKLLIDDYITQVALSIQYVTTLQTAPSHDRRFSSQAKLELLHDTRQAFGRTTLLLQGGSIFGLCHLGVVKALHSQGLLPRIITGTATGALIAALVCVHTEDELLTFLEGDGIDLTCFDYRQRASWGWSDNVLLGALFQQVKRLIHKGYFLDAQLLEECVRDNLGDLTFEEAYARSKRILNITVATSGKTGIPNLLNYLTAPNVLIWSAAAASNSSTMINKQPVTIYCKDETGSIVPWPHSQDAVFRPWFNVHYNDGESPLSRIAELFNVNHFIVSQPRPYLIPFLSIELNLLDRRQAGKWNTTRSLMRLVTAEIRHRLRQLDYLGILPQIVGRLLIEETIPGPNLTLVPDLSLGDFAQLLRRPSKESLSNWVLKGEKGVWPAVSALKVRCVIEIALDKGYQVVRRRGPRDTSPVASMSGPHRRPNESAVRRRRRSDFGLGRSTSTMG